MGKLIDSRTFMFLLFMMLIINLYWFVGIERYETYDVQGIPITTGYPNSLGIMLLILPIAMIIYWYWRKWRLND